MEFSRILFAETIFSIHLAKVLEISIFVFWIKKKKKKTIKIWIVRSFPHANFKVLEALNELLHHEGSGLHHKYEL